MAEAVLVLFPGALGDWLCARPGLERLRARGAALTLVAREPLFPLVAADVRTLSIDRRELSDLFASGALLPATCALLGGHTRCLGWIGADDPAFRRRLECASGAPAELHRLRGMRPGEPAPHYFSRCIGVRPLDHPLAVSAAAAEWAEAFFDRHRLGERCLVVHAGSGSPSKCWEGFAELARAWREQGGRVLSLRGPAEPPERRGPPCDAELRDAPLDRVAAALRRAFRYSGNDSGVSHLAGAVRARGVVVFGDTDPRTWAPGGGTLEILRAPHPCAACGPGRLCSHRLSPTEVLRALRATPR